MPKSPPRRRSPGPCSGTRNPRSGVKNVVREKRIENRLHFMLELPQREDHEKNHDQGARQGIPDSADFNGPYSLL